MYVTSCLGCLRWASWGEFSTDIYGNVAYVQTAAASRTGELLSCLDTDPEFQHQPFQLVNNQPRLTLLQHTMFDSLKYN